MGDVSSAIHKSKGEDKSCKTMKKKWTPKEDAVLISALSELCNSGWKRENGIFRNGYTAALEKKLKSKLPDCNIKASPHIESRLKLLKRQYEAITEMRGAGGMQWNDKDNMLICEDDDVWEEWVQTHTDARGLRNKQFPYYKELHLLFGKRGTTESINNELDIDKVLADEDKIATTNLMMVNDSFEEDVVGNYKVFQVRSMDKELDPTVTNNNGMSLTGPGTLIKHYKKRKTQTNAIRNTSNCNLWPDHEEASDPSEDSTKTNRLNDENLTQPRDSNIKLSNKKNCNSDCGSSELGQLAKIFGTFFEKYDEHLSLLEQIVGREMAAEKIAGEKRAKLNGELTKLPNLNLQARLRAASLIVTDPAKLDLFYSLSKEERREWVSMLLTGLI